MPPQRKQKKYWKNFHHIHLSVTSFFLVAYLLLGSIYSPEFLLSDVRQKFQALADVLIILGQDRL